MDENERYSRAASCPARAPATSADALTHARVAELRQWLHEGGHNTPAVLERVALRMLASLQD